MVRSLHRFLSYTCSCFSLSRHRSSNRRIHRRLSSWTDHSRSRQRISRWFPRRPIRRHHHRNSSNHRARSSRRSYSWNFRRIIRRLSRFSSRHNSAYTSSVCSYNLSYRRLNWRSNNKISFHLSNMKAFSCVVFSGIWSSIIFSSGFFESTMGAN